MKYKAYEKNPHIALEEIKQAFDNEKPYKAQSLCLAYFSYLENQRHIDMALDYHSKDDVYKYVQKHLTGELTPADKSNASFLEDFKDQSERIRKDREDLATVMKAVEMFCADNGMEMEGLLAKYLPKQVKDMSQEELVELNKAINERQKGKVAISKDIAPIPTYEEMEALAKAQTERAFGSLRVLNEALSKVTISDKN